MSDRDTFAAAALTGLMRFRGDSGQRGAVWKSTAVIVAEAYDLADAMLRERCVNHDAAPAARARTDADSARTDKAAPRPGEGTGNTQEPVAWAVIGKERMAGHVIGLYDTVLEARSRVGRMVSYGDIYAAYKVEIVHLYRSPTLTDEEREAVEAAIIGGCEMSATLRNMLERMA